MQGEQERLWKMSVDQTRHAVNKLQQQGKATVRTVLKNLPITKFLCLVQIADQHGNPLDLPEEEKRVIEYYPCHT